MNYHFIDRSQDFEFHDSIWELISWKGDTLILEATCLNVHKDALPDPPATDMEIAAAQMTFHGFSTLTLEPWQVLQEDETDPLFYTYDPHAVHTVEAAQRLFCAQLQAGISIFALEQISEIYEVSVSSATPPFTLCFTCQQVEIAWDGFRGPAWYENRK